MSSPDAVRNTRDYADKSGTRKLSTIPKKYLKKGFRYINHVWFPAKFADDVEYSNILEFFLGSVEFHLFFSLNGSKYIL